MLNSVPAEKSKNKKENKFNMNILCITSTGSLNLYKSPDEYIEV